MKVVFLDVDGVLNSVRDYYSTDLATDSHFILLKELVDRTGAKIVLSSSWRFGHVERVRERLKKFGMDIIGCTPSPFILPDGQMKGFNSKRGDEIRYYLEHCDEEVESFVILDDDSDMCEYTTTNLVQTDSMFGLQKEHVERAMGILNA